MDLRHCLFRIKGGPEAAIMQKNDYGFKVLVAKFYFSESSKIVSLAFKASELISIPGRQVNWSKDQDGADDWR
ncbi:hypothetical protein QL285_009495 [Trifolium repens]|nr:hypothetical protein QL285_009495 [Trifolium repens]